MPTSLTTPAGSQADLVRLLEPGQVMGTTPDYPMSVEGLEGGVALNHGAHFFDHAGLEGATS